MDPKTMLMKDWIVEGVASDTLQKCAKIVDRCESFAQDRVKAKRLIYTRVVKFLKPRPRKSPSPIKTPVKTPTKLIQEKANMISKKYLYGSPVLHDTQLPPNWTDMVQKLNRKRHLKFDSMKEEESDSASPKKKVKQEKEEVEQTQTDY